MFSLYKKIMHETGISNIRFSVETVIKYEVKYGKFEHPRGACTDRVKGWYNTDVADQGGSNRIE